MLCTSFIDSCSGLCFINVYALGSSFNKLECDVGTTLGEELDVVVIPKQGLCFFELNDCRIC